MCKRRLLKVTIGQAPRSGKAPPRCQQGSWPGVVKGAGVPNGRCRVSFPTSPDYPRNATSEFAADMEEVLVGPVQQAGRFWKLGVRKENRNVAGHGDRRPGVSSPHLRGGSFSLGHLPRG